MLLLAITLLVTSFVFGAFGVYEDNYYSRFGFKPEMPLNINYFKASTITFLFFLISLCIFLRQISNDF